MDKTVRYCDACKNEVDPHDRVIDAGVYGAHFHIECFISLDALEVVQLLGLDDIKLYQQDKLVEGTKLIYDKKFENEANVALKNMRIR